MIRPMPLARYREKVQGAVPCDHRTVSKDGRIICLKITEGDNGITPDLCQRCPFTACPFTASNCDHLRFSLHKTSPSPLVVRFNGRTEIWDDDPPQIRFRQAACVARVLPIDGPRACVGCELRKPVQAPERARVARPAPRRGAPHQPGTVVPFPRREIVPAPASALAAVPA
jgi:hypothetical protein